MVQLTASSKCLLLSSSALVFSNTAVRLSSVTLLMYPSSSALGRGKEGGMLTPTTQPIRPKRAGIHPHLSLTGISSLAAHLLILLLTQQLRGGCGLQQLLETDRGEEGGIIQERMRAQQRREGSRRER